MAIITLYKTKLDRYNRMGSLGEYESYLNSSPSKQFSFNKPFTDKSGVLYINETQDQTFLSQYYQYNYSKIETKTGNILHAFVNLVPLATGGFRVNVSPDYWHTYLEFKSSGDTTIQGSDIVDLHGKCIRAHINEWEEYDSETGYYSKPTLKNTYLTQEEDCSAFAFKRISMPYLGSIGVGMTDEDRVKTKYIYIYIQNPSASTFTDDIAVGLQTKSAPYSNERIPGASCVGITICGVVDIYGSCYFHSKISSGVGESGIEGKSKIHISNLTSSFITTMFISDIPPVTGARISAIRNVETEKVEYYYVDYSETDFIDTTGLVEGGVRNYDLSQGLPEKFCISRILDMKVTISTSKANAEDTSIDSSYRCRRFDNDFYKHIVKSKSFVYQPVVFSENIIDTLNATSVSISLSPDGSSYFTYINSPNDILNSALSVSSNDRIFAPDTVRDYWTTLDASRAAKSAMLENYNAYSQLKGSIKSTASSTVSLLGSSKKGLASSITNLATDAAGIADSIVPTILKEDIANINFEFATKQMVDGITQSQYSPSYYSSITNEKQLDKVLLKPSEHSISVIEEKLHRYGFATFLLLEDVLENHKRAQFNYIKCSQVDMHGLDIDVVEDVTDMFLNGVHLWHGYDVGNYEQNNYQISV